MLKHIIFITFIATSSIIFARVQSPVRFAKASHIFSMSPALKSENTLSIDSKFNRVISFKPESAASIFFTPEKALVISGFPVGVQSFGDVQLQRVEQISDAQTLWYFNNEVRTSPQAIMYSGFIQGESGSKVKLCMVNDRIYGLVSHSNGETMAIGPSNNYDKSSGEHILASNADPRMSTLGANFHCDADNFFIPDANVDQKPFAIPTASNLLEVEVGVEVDAPVFKRFLAQSGNDENKAYEATQAYIYALFAMASSLYEDEINVMLTLPFVKMWKDYNESGYPGYNQYGGDVGQILDDASTKWSRVPYSSGAYKRDILHVCTAGATGMAGGVAYTGSMGYSGAICLQDLGYGVSSLYVNAQLPVIAYIWDVMVVTHEMGHNFRSPHTHNCQGNVWPNNQPLDTCVTRPSVGDACFKSPVSPRLPWNKGTIMSYCHLLNENNGSVLEFRPITAAVIRNGAERAVQRGCVSEPAKPIVKLQYPLGRNLIEGGKYDTIRWTSAKVNTVRVEYSDDNGEKWKQIGSNIAAGVRRIPWLVPMTASKKFLIRVFDVTNVAVGDSSWVNFSVAAPSVELQYPVGGERIGQQETPTILWTSQLINGVKIEFSSDGGVNWTIISSSVTGNAFTWDVPDITTSKAMIRVTALSDGSLISQSGTFSIGKEMLRITNSQALIGLCRNKTGKLEWMSDFISPSARVHIAITTNGGSTWTRLTNALGKGAADNSFENWNVPDIISDNVKIRIYHRDNPLIADTVNATIIECSANAVKENTFDSRISSIAIMPNPAQNTISMRVNLLKELAHAEIFITDMAGRKIQFLENIDNAPVGEAAYSFNVSKIANGSYFLTLQSKEQKISAPFEIVR